MLFQPKLTATPDPQLHFKLNGKMKQDENNETENDKEYVAAFAF